MAKQRELTAREQEQAATRLATVDMLRATDSGINYLAKREAWDNARRSAVMARVVMAARSLTSVKKNGQRRALEEAPESLGWLKAEVYGKDAALAAARAEKAKAATTKAAPFAAEIAAVAQGEVDIEDADPDVVQAAVELAESVGIDAEAA